MKNMTEKWKLIYDITSIPRGWEMEDVIQWSNELGIIMWDSYNKGEEPKLVDATVELEIVDLNND